MMQNKLRQNPFLLALTGGLLLYAAWPMSPFTFLIFIAFIPLLLLSDLKLKRGRYFLCIYIAMLIWNVTTTWWIWYASEPGAIAAFIANSLLMCLPWLLYRKVKQYLHPALSLLALISFWMVFEFLHLQDWGLSWPWLSVGNVFANRISWIQWYEITGISGGTLWAWVVNVFLFYCIRNYQKGKLKYVRSSLILIAIIAFPLFYSFSIGTLVRLSSITAKKTKKTGVAIVQPNIDPYEKIEKGTFKKQLDILLEKSKEIADSSTKLLIWPETALFSENRFDENDINKYNVLDTVYSFLKQYPDLQIFSGIESYKFFPEPTLHSRTFPDMDIHYESYNSSVLINRNGPRQFYHKSKLVPGVETLPSFLNILGKWFEKFGGTTNGYVKNEERTVIFTGKDSSGKEESATLQLAPSICYESIYGEFMSEYVNNGANLIAIITNDGWWKNTPGHKQHMSYARLRAIENRTWVARSANTGISCFIDPIGIVHQPQPYNTIGAIKTGIPNTQSSTFYTRHPDLLYKIFYGLAMLLLGLYLFKVVKPNPVNPSR